MIQSGYLTEDAEFELVDIKNILCGRFDLIDFSQAKSDITPFIRDKHVLDIWSADFFKQITESLSERE